MKQEAHWLKTMGSSPVPFKIKDDSGLEEIWNRFKRVNYFVDDLLWGEVSETIVDNIEKIAVS